MEADAVSELMLGAVDVMNHAHVAKDGDELTEMQLVIYVNNEVIKCQ